MSRGGKKLHPKKAAALVQLTRGESHVCRRLHGTKVVGLCIQAFVRIRVTEVENHHSVRAASVKPSHHRVTRLRPKLQTAVSSTLILFPLLRLLALIFFFFFLKRVTEA